MNGRNHFRRFVDPRPPAVLEVRFVVPLLAQEASYFAASARIASFLDNSIEDSTHKTRDLLQKCSNEHVARKRHNGLCT